MKPKQGKDKEQTYHSETQKNHKEIRQREREWCKMREREKLNYFPRINGQLLNRKPENIRMVFQCIKIREVSTDDLISNKKVFKEWRW